MQGPWPAAKGAFTTDVNQEEGGVNKSWQGVTLKREKQAHCQKQVVKGGGGGSTFTQKKMTQFVNAPTRSVCHEVKSVENNHVWYNDIE